MRAKLEGGSLCQVLLDELVKYKDSKTRIQASFKDRTSYLIG